MIFLWPTGSVVVHEAAAKRNRYVRAADYTIGIHKRSDFTGCRSSCWLAINPKTKGKCIVRESVRSDKNLIEIRVLFDVSYKPAHSNLSLSESSHGFFLKIKCNRFKSASRCSRSHSTAVSCLDLFEWQESANWHGSREIKVDHSRHVCVNTNSQTVDTRLFSLGWRDCIIFIGTGSFFFIRTQWLRPDNHLINGLGYSSSFYPNHFTLPGKNHCAISVYSLFIFLKMNFIDFLKNYNCKIKILK